MNFRKSPGGGKIRSEDVLDDVCVVSSIQFEGLKSPRGTQSSKAPLHSLLKP